MGKAINWDNFQAVENAVVDNSGTSVRQTAQLRFEVVLHEYYTVSRRSKWSLEWLTRKLLTQTISGKFATHSVKLEFVCGVHKKPSRTVDTPLSPQHQTGKQAVYLSPNISRSKH